MEEAAEVKHEYYQGEIFAMAGGTLPHNRIVRNILAPIDNFPQGKNCEVFPSDLKVHNEANTLLPILASALFAAIRNDGTTATTPSPTRLY